jgi:hypothetical protein
VARHLAGGLSDLSYSDPAGTGGSTATGSTTSSTSSGTGSATGGAAGSTPSGIAGAGGTGGTGGSPPAPGHPPGVTADFDSGSLDTSVWAAWSDGLSTTGVEGGILFVQPASVSGNDWAGISNYPMFGLSNCSVWVELVQALDSGVPGGAFFELLRDQNNEAQFFVLSGEIRFQVRTNGTDPAPQSLPYDLVAHRWLRFREEGGSLHLETSPNGQQWTVRRTETTPTFLSQVEVRLGGGTWDYSATPGRIELDNVNRLP